MSHNVLVSVFCPDRTGLIADIAGALFDLGANLGDTNFAVLGGGAEFTAVCEIPDSITGDDLAAALRRVPDVANGKLSIAPFTLEPLHGETGRITHRVTVRRRRPARADRPALGSVRGIRCERGSAIIGKDAGRQLQYPLLGLDSEHPRAAACLATIANTAENLHLSCHVEGMLNQPG